MYMKCINNLQPRHLDTVFLFFFLFNKKKKKHPCQFDWYTKNRNGQAFVWILFFVTCRRVTETKSSTAEMQSQSLVPPLLSTFLL